MNFISSDENAENADKTLFAPLISRIWLSLHPFVCNSELLNDTACRFPVLNFS